MLSSANDKGLCVVISFLTFIYNNILEAKYTETKVNTKFIELEAEIKVAALANGDKYRAGKTDWKNELGGSLSLLSPVTNRSN